MNTLTTEDRGKVFALYYGSKYSYVDDGGVEITEEVSGITVECICDNDHVGNPQLSLYDLSDITDEDAVEVAKIYYETDEGSWQQGKGVINLLIKEPYIKLVHPRFDTICAVIDFLRSRLYALPYKGINLFDAGIAKRIKS